MPSVFFTPINEKLIKRAVLSTESAERQPKGRKKLAGRNYSARYYGRRSLPNDRKSINTDRARLPRKKNRRAILSGDVANVPQAVGGPRVIVPKVQKILHERINKKERRAALLSAVASTLNLEWIQRRHVVDGNIELPFIVESGFEDLNKTQKVINALKALKLYADIESAKGKRRTKAGRGKTRGRKFKQKKSILIVTGKQARVYKASRNIPGVDICPIQKLNTRLLAPGTQPGRLVVWSETAIKVMETW